MATFTSTTDGNINDGGTYGNTSPGTAGVDFPGTDDICVVGGSTTVTLNTNFECRALKITGTLAGGSNTITLNGATSNKPLDHDGTITGDLNVTITNTGMQQNGLLLDGSGVAGNINNLTINLTSATASNNTIEFSPSLVLDNTLTITAGVFQPYSSAFSLTVGGHIFGNGTFNANDSTVTVAGQCAPANVGLIGGSITSTDDFRPTTKTTITGDGTITANGGAQIGGLFDIGATNAPTLQAGRLHSTLDIPSGNQGQSTFNLALSEDQTGPSRSVYFYNLTLDSEGTENNTLTLADSMFVTNNLTITDGEISCNGRNLTVTNVTSIGPGSGGSDQATLTCSSGTMSFGSGITSSFGVIVNQGGTFTGGTGAHTMGSFEVKNNSNAKMTMTNGECTIDSEKSSDARAILVETNATFDNNDGTIKITHAGDTDIEFKSGTTSPKCPHNLTIDKSNNDVITHGNLQIDGNLFIKIVDISHSMRPSSASDTLTVLGNVTINKGKLGDTTNYTGTLDFRDQVNINTDGVLIASSGTTKIAGTMDFDGTFTHNGGTVKLENTSEKTHSVANGTTFNHLQKTTAETMTFATNSQVTIISTLTINPSCNFKTRNGNQFTFGDASTACTVTNNGTFTNRNNNNTVTFQAGSQLKPFVFTGNDFDWAGDASSGNVQNYVISNCNWDPDITTGEYVSIQLAGDCEFDAFTVSANSTLDLNGQRAVFGGAFDLTTGALAMNDAMAVFTNTIDFNGRVPTSNTGTTIIHNPPSTSEKLITSLYFGGTFFAQGAESDVNGYAWGGSSGEYPAKVFVGGQLDCQQSVKTNTLMQVATGGELRGNDRTLTCEGDFTKSGGLIGKSAVKFDDTDSNTTGFINCGSDSGIDNKFDGGGTIEAWIKPNSKGQLENYGGIIASKVFWYFSTTRDSGSNTCKLTFKQFFDGDDSEWNTTDHVITYNEWNHVAITYDNSDVANNPIMYINGKQVALTRDQAATGTRNSDAGYNFFIGNYDANDNMHFDGTIAMVRYFDDIRTESEIRADMFNEHADMANTGDLIAMWQFDEGSGTTIDNKGSVGAAADGTLTAGSVSGGWVGGGTFVQGTSTLTFSKSGAQTLNFYSSDNFNNIKIEAGSTTSLNGFGLGSGAPLDCFGNLIVSGTLTDSGDNSIVKLRTADKTHDFSGTLTGLYSMIVDISSGNLNIPALNTPRLRFSTSVTGTATGNLTITEELQVDTNTTFVANGKTITTKLVDLNDGTFNLGEGTLILSHTGASNGFDTNAASVLAAGPGATISGSSAGTTFKSRNNFVVVGKVENLNVTEEELSVTGQVINCTGDIIQQHPTIDHDQQLDFDTADDRDIILGRDLDKNTELINS